MNQFTSGVTPFTVTAWKLRHATSQWNAVLVLYGIPGCCCTQDGRCCPNILVLHIRRRSIVFPEFLFQCLRFGWLGLRTTSSSYLLRPAIPRSEEEHTRQCQVQSYYQQMRERGPCHTINAMLSLVAAFQSRAMMKADVHTCWYPSPELAQILFRPLQPLVLVPP